MLQELKLLAHKKNAEKRPPQPADVASASESSSGSDHEVFSLFFLQFCTMHNCIQITPCVIVLMRPLCCCINSRTSMPTWHLS